ncbi:hypothetical protein [Streptomyces sp. NPDC097981]|uniref:hypothetical protein n=1 Tax=Streptomyces sp. NPDC097981 TaxID=3155428 RepID=UPI003324E68E
MQTDPFMPIAQLQRLLRERDELLPLIDSPPRVSDARPASTGLAGGLRLDAGARWAPVELIGLTGAVPLAAGMTMVPIGTGPPPVPPSVLFPELAAPIAEAGTAVGAAEAGGAALGAAEIGTAAAGAELGTAAAAAGGTSLVPVVGWVVAGVIVIGVVGYLVYRHCSTSVAVPARPPEPVHAPGAPGGGPVSLPGAPPASGPVSAPGAAAPGAVSLPGARTGGPATFPGVPHTGDLVLASRAPTNRTDFTGPHARDDALRRARELARSLINGDLEVLENVDVFRTPEENGHVTYYRRVGSTAHMRGAEPWGNIVAIVEHKADPTQPPHFHVVRPPFSGKRIEHGGEYYEPFAGTGDQHLTYWLPGTAPPR